MYLGPEFVIVFSIGTQNETTFFSDALLGEI